MWQITSFTIRGNVFGSFASMSLTLRYNDGSQVETSYEFPTDAKSHHLEMARAIYNDRREMANSAGVNVTERMSEAFRNLINKGA